MAVSTSTESVISTDELLEAIANERRRFVIRTLADEGPSEKALLAEQIAALENDTTVKALTAQQRKRVYIGLHQSHLPLLEQAGIVKTDHDDGVAPGPAHGVALEALERVDATVRGDPVDVDDEGDDSTSSSLTDRVRSILGGGR